MSRIETERWRPVPGKPHAIEYEGPRAADEVFAELRNQLEATGYLPDEYFLLDDGWENGVDFPRDADIFCVTNYGSSEGIYLDISVKFKDENQKYIIKHFATGKTLNDSQLALDRMHLVASAVIKAFHSDGIHARYLQVGNPKKDDGMLLHLSDPERLLLAESLIDMREKLKYQYKPFQESEQLLRRLIGDITEYIQTVGERPLAMDDYDAAVLAVQDNNLTVFNDLSSRVTERHGGLLIHAAAHPGRIGSMMTESLLERAAGITNEEYLSACKNAVDIGDTARVMHMLEQAPKCVADLDCSLYGEVLYQTLTYGNEHKCGGTKMARSILNELEPEQIQNANPYIISLALSRRDENLACDLIRKGVDVSEHSADLYWTAACERYVWLIDHLTKHGGDINADNFGALRACVRCSNQYAAELLIDHGADFKGFREWSMSVYFSDADMRFIENIGAYWKHRNTM